MNRIMNRSRQYIQLEGSRQSSFNSAINDRAVQNPESRRIRLGRIASTVVVDGLVETILSLLPEEEDDPPGYFDILKSSGTVSTHIHTHHQEGGGEYHPQSKAKKKEKPQTNSSSPSLPLSLSSPNKNPSSSPSKNYAYILPSTHKTNPQRPTSNPA